MSGDDSYMFIDDSNIIAALDSGARACDGVGTSTEVTRACNLIESYNVGASYAITIKPTFKSNIRRCKENDDFLLNMMCHWVSQFPSFILKEYMIELDSKQVPHVHLFLEIGIYTCLSDMRDKKVKGWHIYVKQCYDYGGWVDYIMKSVD